MKKIRAITILTILALSLMMLAGCTTMNNFKEAFIDKPQDKEAIIQIGVFEPLTGADADAAKDEIRGIELANKVYPNVHGKIIELVYSDNKSDMDAAITAIQTLIVKEPKAIIGSYSSVLSLAAGEYVHEAKIPTITPTNTNPLVTKNNKYYYRVCYVDANQGDILARYVLEEKKSKKAGILLPLDDDIAMATATAFASRIRSETGNRDAIAAYEEYTEGQKDFTKELKAIKKAKVKYVLLPGENKDAANIIKQAKQMGIEAVFLGDREWGDVTFAMQLGSSVKSKDIAFVQLFAADAKTPKDISEEKQKFLDAYKEAYGDEVPSDDVALGYDAYMVAVDAIGKAGADATSEEINKVLQEPRYEFTGVSGTINFDSVGDPIKTSYICTWRKGVIDNVCTIEPLDK